MIIRKDQPPTTSESDGTESRLEARRISDAGGLTQFGAYVHTLEPGARASNRHYHEEEDEFLYMLSGEATVVENDGAHVLLPGDAACWPAGTANAHQVVNRSSARCSYLICGTRVARDIVHYPELGQTLYIDGRDWRILRADGTLLKQGRNRLATEAAAMPPPIRIPARLERPLLASVLGAPAALLRRIVGPPTFSPDGFELDLQLQVLLWMMRVTKEPPLFHGSLAQARGRMERSARLMDHVALGGVTTEALLVPGGGERRAARLYRPRTGGRGGLVWFHGGGFVVGSLASHEGICRALAVRSGVTILSVDYRLAPEHPFPAGLEDAAAATRWALSNAEALGLEPDRIAVGGDSAGGNLAAVVSRMLVSEPRRPAFQLLVYPATDATRSHASHGLFKDGFVLTAESIAWFVDHWLPAKELLRDPRASPLFEASLAGLPPALVVTAGFDPLRDEGRRYAERMREAGNEVDLVQADGMVHGFINMGAVVRAADRVVDDVAVRLRRALA